MTKTTTQQLKKAITALGHRAAVHPASGDWYIDDRPVDQYTVREAMCLGADDAALYVIQSATVSR